MASLKQEMQQKLELGDIRGLLPLMDAYGDRRPEDIDLLCLKTAVAVAQDEPEEALRTSLLAFRRAPYYVDANFNLAFVWELLGDYRTAYRYYHRCLVFSEQTRERKEDIPLPQMDYQAKKAELIDLINAQVQKGVPVAAVREQLADILEQEKCNFRIKRRVFIDNQSETMVGNFYTDPDGRKYYVGRYNEWLLNSYPNTFRRDLVFNTAEFMPDAVNTNFLRAEDGCDCLLPVACKELDTSMTFRWETGPEANLDTSPETDLGTGPEAGCTLKNRSLNRFQYFRVKGGTAFASDKEVVAGKPIPLRQNASGKKLVLNLFVDGLTGITLQNGDLQKYMPATYEFFSKGVVCTNAFSTSEYTYPSIASFWSGLYTTSHLMYHGEIDTVLPDDICILSEYFKNAGFTTGKIGGDWRITPDYGYGRGLDRILYQLNPEGLHAPEAVDCALEHLKLFRETSQFLWLEIEDLHEIADGIDMPVSLQAVLPVEKRTVSGVQVSSVKQDYSDNQISAYKLQMERVDQYLKLLYDYIEKNYRDEEILVSFFADHGQGFFIKDGEHKLSDPRTRIPLLIRSGYRPGSVCDEYISAVDYMPIMCSLAGIDYAPSRSDGRLPAFFGGDSCRDYVLSEWMYPGDRYSCALHAPSHSFYFDSEKKTQWNGLTDFESYETSLLDAHGRKLNDPALSKACADIVLDHVAPLRRYF